MIHMLRTFGLWKMGMTLMSQMITAVFRRTVVRKRMKDSWRPLLSIRRDARRDERAKEKDKKGNILLPT